MLRTIASVLCCCSAAEQNSGIGLLGSVLDWVGHFTVFLLGLDPAQVLEEFEEGLGAFQLPAFLSAHFPNPSNVELSTSCALRVGGGRFHSRPTQG